MEKPTSLLNSGLDASAGARYDRGAVEAAIAATCARIAPLWPLKHFVAVNPFLGFRNRSFHATCALMHRVTRIDMLMPRAFYREALATGRIEDCDIEEALNSAPCDWRAPRTLNELKAALARDTVHKVKHAAHVATVAEVLDSLASGDRNASRTAFMTDEISKWCAAYFDEGQSAWRLPERVLRPYAAWRAAMRYDRSAEVMGVAGFRTIVASLPDDPIEAVGIVVQQLGVPARALEEYLFQALLDIGGWASYARYLVWNNELNGHADDTLAQLLAIRIVWGFALFVQRTDAAFLDAWRSAMHDAAMMPLDEQLGEDPELCVDLILQEAYEVAYQRRLLTTIAQSRSNIEVRSHARPRLQAAFCIDTRSEVFRRAVESVSADVQTIGFAGFFGYPIEYVPIGYLRGGAQCPVLLKPAFIVCEGVADASDADNDEILGLRLLRRRVGKAWKSFKVSAVSSFIFVETAGLMFGAKIVSDSLGITRTVNDPDTDGLDAAVIDRLRPNIEPRTVGGRETGFTDDARIAMAEAALRGMSRTGDFAPLVLMVGHGSTTVNNPHASSLDCGACGGHTGEANARVAATILNDPIVRSGLRSRGIDIPDDTWFLGCLHDTTTDVIRIFDDRLAPESHRARITEARDWLARATTMTRVERSASLGVPRDSRTERRVVARSRDWAQVRPEWGLAGNAAFIAAPRALTRGVDLGGRAFLHDYDWRNDAELSVLELIMTAPMVVASWINLQYYGSTVNNRAFGAGNKVLHNVTGVIGVLEGNAGDLKLGLPWQSVHDGQRFIHEPLRLNVFIAAPTEALNGVIAKHEAVRELLDNRWLHLFAVADDGAITQRYHRDLRWIPVSSRISA